MFQLSESAETAFVRLSPSLTLHSSRHLAAQFLHAARRVQIDQIKIKPSGARRSEHEFRNVRVPRARFLHRHQLLRQRALPGLEIVRPKICPRRSITRRHVLGDERDASIRQKPGQVIDLLVLNDHARLRSIALHHPDRYPIAAGKRDPLAICAPTDLPPRHSWFFASCIREIARSIVA